MHLSWAQSARPAAVARVALAWAARWALSEEGDSAIECSALQEEAGGLVAVDSEEQGSAVAD